MNTDVEGLTEKIIGCGFSVSNSLGAGFLEGVYERALGIEFDLNGIGYSNQQQLKVVYRNCQLLNYMKASGIKTGLLINFGRPRIEIKRMALRSGYIRVYQCSSVDK